MALQVGASIVSVRRRVGNSGRASSELHPKAGRLSMGFAFGFQWRAVHADHDLDFRAKVSNLSVVLGVRKLSPHLERAALFRFTDSRMRGGAFVVRCERRAHSNRATKRFPGRRTALQKRRRTCQVAECVKGGALQIRSRIRAYGSIFITPIFSSNRR